jgi:hypothetical protein
MRWIVATAILAVSFGGSAIGSTACDRDPNCNQGRGAVIHHVCVRSEVNPVGNEFNGRVCAHHPRENTIYVYLRGLSNREPVVVCNDGTQVVPPTMEQTEMCKPI